MSDEETAATADPAEGVEPTAEDEIDESIDPKAEPDSSEEMVTGKIGGRLGAVPVIPLVLVLALLASGALAGWLFFTEYRPDQQTDAAVAQSVVTAAREGTVALLSYKPDTLDQDFAAAKSHLTGDFLNYYNDFTKQVVTPAAKSKGVTTAAQVVGAAPVELQPNSAVVLVFVNQLTTSKERPDPSMASSSVKLSLTKQNGQWLINKFDPI